MTGTLSSANISSSLQCMIRIWIWIYVFLAVCWWLVSWPSLRVAPDVMSWCLRPGARCSRDMAPAPARPRHPGSLYFNLGSLCGQAETMMATLIISGITHCEHWSLDKCEAGGWWLTLRGFHWQLYQVHGHNPRPRQPEAWYVNWQWIGLCWTNTFVKR